MALKITYWVCKKCDNRKQTTNPHVVKMKCDCGKFMFHGNGPFPELVKR